MLFIYLFLTILFGFFINIGIRLSNFALGRLYVWLTRPSVKSSYKITEKGDFYDGHDSN